ncbi:hypothetical protein ACVR1G_01885 [Streptococcus dentasini]
MYLEQSQAQAASAKALAQQEIQAYEELEAALEEFENSQADLKGKAYDSARLYSESVLRPLVAGAKRLAQAVGEAVQRFPEAYMEQVAHESLKESELEMAIAELNLRISNARDAVDAMNLDRHDANEGARLNSYNRMIEIGESSKRVLEEKLEKLRAFHASSPQLFSEIDALKSVVETGLSEAGQCWDSKSGTFKVPKDKDWVKQLNTIMVKAGEVLSVSKEERVAFRNMLQTQYGFSAEEADIMLDVYVGLVKEYDGDKDKANQQFFVYMGSFVYGDSYVGGYSWSYVGGLIKPDEVEKKLKDLGISSKKIETLKTAILNQSAITGLSGTTEEKLATLKKKYPESTESRLKELLKQFDGKTDFAHTSATVSAHYEKNLFFDGTQNKYAGYYGDLTIPGDISMNNGDYHADLDAVNLYNQLKGDKNLVTSMNTYFDRVESDDSYRAEQFVTNIGDGDYDKGMKILESEYEVYTFQAGENPLYKDFIDSLKEKSDDLKADGK